LACCLIPGGIYSFISGIIITVQGIRLLGRNADRLWARTGTIATLQICNVFALNPICVICGIVTHVLLRNDEVMNYIKNTAPNAGQKK
jgi:3,4-dihydroxy-2-butanone 4-phosphate synthase